MTSPKLISLTLLLSLVGLWCLPLNAQTRDVYVIDNVAVDETAKSAAEARKAAIPAGQRAAFDRLVTRIVPDGEREKLPPMDQARLNTLVSGFEIKSEKNSNVRYIAELSFRFSPTAVRRFLRNSGVGFSETPSKPLLVLPVLRRDAALTLWEEPNPWRQAWLEQPVSDGLVPLVVPGVDPTQVGIISAEQAMNGDQERISAIARKYGAEDALLAVATMRTDSASGDHILELVVSRFGSGVSDKTDVSSFRGPTTASPESLLLQAAGQIVRAISEEWKIQNQLQFDNQQMLNARIKLSGLPNWISIQQRLKKIASIDRVDVTSLARGEARVRLHYFGDRAQLALGMAQQNLVLAEGAVDWDISEASSKPGP